MKSVIALGLLACSGLAQAAPVTISFEGDQVTFNNDDVGNVDFKREMFTVTVDFEKCTLVSGGETFKGSSCTPDNFVWSVSHPEELVPFSLQTWLYAKPDGSYMYTFQMAHGWKTSMLRGTSYKVVR